MPVLAVRIWRVFKPWLLCTAKTPTSGPMFHFGRLKLWRNALKSTYSNAGHRIFVRSLLLIRAEAIMFGHVGAAELAAAVVGGQGRIIPFRGRAVSTCPRRLDHDRMVWA